MRDVRSRLLPAPRAWRFIAAIVGLAVGIPLASAPGVPAQAQSASPPPAWAPITGRGAPSPHRFAVWTGSEVLFGDGGYEPRFQALPDGIGSRYDPVADRWRPMENRGAPSPRHDGTWIWAGTELVVWGGTGPEGPRFDGARYDPSTDQWRSMAADGAPHVRSPQAVWTGQELLVYSANDPAFIGGRYDPRTDQWATISTEGAPHAPTYLTAPTIKGVWTDHGLLLWGGVVGTEDDPRALLSVGAIYDPQLDQWQPMATPEFLSPRWGFSMVWTGQEVLIWGGGRLSFSQPLANPWGARYRPAHGTWQALAQMDAPDLRIGHHAFWTGREMLIWGGSPEIITRFAGGRYDPVTDTWVEMEPAPEVMRMLAGPSVWTGREFVVWGGYTGSRLSLRTVYEGARYTPYWLTTRAPTEVYSLTDDLLRVAEPGERYRVTNRDQGFALVVRVGETADQSVWIRLDDRVTLEEGT